MLYNSSFRNTDRHIVVNVVYAVTFFAIVFLHMCLVCGLLCNGSFEFTTDWLLGNEFWSRPARPPSNVVCSFFAWIDGWFGTYVVIYIGYVGLCHFFTAVKKVAIFIGRIAKTVIVWMDNTNIA